jgi:uncharacterized phiE125 gp8 family phage protein
MTFCSATTWQDYYQSSRSSAPEMRHKVLVVTPPASEPVTIAEAKAQLHIGASDSSHDSELTAFIASAREEWERDTQSALINRTIEHRQPRFSDIIRLTVLPVVEIESVIYVDRDGDEQTMDDGDYYLDVDELRFSGTTPPVADRSDAVRIRYIAGYGESAASVPQFDKMAIKLSLANRFEDRDMISAGGERKAYEAMVAKKMRPSYP